MDTLILKLQKNFPALAFSQGARFAWSPDKNQVLYKQTANEGDELAIWSLLHEVGHAMLNHNVYNTDFELLRLEVAAWEQAQSLASTYGYNIAPDHIEDCLDTYRDWLYQRSTCPSCTSCSLQTDKKTYNCFNCDTTWQVSSSRLCRPYRKLAKASISH